MSEDDRLLRERYEAIALTGDVATTACDYQLRDLEIDFGWSTFVMATEFLMSDVGPVSLFSRTRADGRLLLAELTMPGIWWLLPSAM